MPNTLADIVQSKPEDIIGEGLRNNHSEEASGRPDLSVTREGSVEEANHRSAPLKLMSDEESREELSQLNSTGIFDTKKHIDAEVKAITEARNPDRPDHYLHPAHFAQLNGNRGGILYIPDFNNSQGQHVKTIKFDNGVYSTTDIRIAEAIRKSISRNNGSAKIVTEVTEQHYQNILSSGRAAQRLIKSQGVTTTQDTLGTSAGQADKLEKENQELRKQIAKMREDAKKLEASGQKTVEDKKGNANIATKSEASKAILQNIGS